MKKRVTASSVVPTSQAYGRRQQIVALTALTLGYAINLADRSIISALAAPIQREFHLSDTMIGVMTGGTIAIFFVFASLPLGYLADRVNRRAMAAACQVLFGVMTIACGLAPGFGLLLLARVGVGIGESGATPAALALLSDIVPASSRGFTMSVFSLGIPIGIAVGLAGVSLLLGPVGWRGTLIAFGLITLLCTLPLMFVREPARMANAKADGQSSIFFALKQFLSDGAMRNFLLGNLLGTMWLWGVLLWLPLYLVRVHGYSDQAAGAVLSLMHGLVGGTAMVVTVIVMRWLARYDFKFQLLALTAMFVIVFVPSVLAFSTSSRPICLAMLWIVAAVAYAYNGPGFAIAATLAPPHMRAQAIASFTLSGAIGNYLIAPLGVGMGSDFLAGLGLSSGRALQLMLLVLCLGGSLSILAFWRSSWHYARRLSKMDVSASKPHDRTATAAFKGRD